MLCPNIFRISREFFERERARHYDFSIHTPSLSIFGYAGARLRTDVMVDLSGVGLCQEDLKKIISKIEESSIAEHTKNKVF